MVNREIKTCENCLFYVEPMPGMVICVGHKRIKEYANIQNNCKRWVENTSENAKEWLRTHK